MIRLRPGSSNPMNRLTAVVRWEHRDERHRLLGNTQLVRALRSSGEVE